MKESNAMTKATASRALAVTPRAEEAWRAMDACFGRFCLTAGIEAPQAMMAADVEDLCEADPRTDQVAQWDRPTWATSRLTRRQKDDGAMDVAIKDEQMAPVYLQYGCGFCVGKDWLNFDSSPTLRIERLPVIGNVLGRIAGNSRRFPKEVKYGNIAKGLPIAENSVRGVYASHVLEHLALDDFRKALRNTFNT